MEHSPLSGDSVIFLIGPTGTGKSSVLSALLGPANTNKKSKPDLTFSVVNSDSMQLYSNLPVATAAPVPPPEQPDGGSTLYCGRDFIKDDLLSSTPTFVTPLNEPNCPKSYENYTRAQYVSDAVKLVDAALGSGKIPVVVGGTMSYNLGLLQALCGDGTGDEENNATDSYTSPEFMSYFNGLEDPHATLCEVRPEVGETLHPRNLRKVRRALQIWWDESHGTSSTTTTTTATITAAPAARSRPRILIVYIDGAPPLLASRLASRITTMRSSIVTEVTSLYSRFVAEVIPTIPHAEVSRSASGAPLVPNVGLFQAIGFKEFLPYIYHQFSDDGKDYAGSADALLEDCYAVLLSNSVKYTKKQRATYRNSVLKYVAGVEEVAVKEVGIGEGADGVWDWLMSGTATSGGASSKSQPGADGKPPTDALKRTCERCEKTVYGSTEWEVHLKSKMHKVRGSRKWLEAQENKKKFCK
jgi:tRNA dimethylallyltransferase